MDSTTLVIGVITGAIGTGFLVYGKKQEKVVPFVAGLLLCILPYVIDNQPLLICACVALVAAPFFIKI